MMCDWTPSIWSILEELKLLCSQQYQSPMTQRAAASSAGKSNAPHQMTSRDNSSELREELKKNYKRIADLETCIHDLTLRASLVYREFSRDNSSELREEVKKNYKRIADLETCIHDLTLRASLEIPSDTDLSHVDKPRLESKYLKMEELKKKAEFYALEAKKTSQRLAAENFKLQKNLSKERHQNWYCNTHCKIFLVWILLPNILFRTGLTKSAANALLWCTSSLKEVIGAGRGSAPPLDYVVRFINSKFWVMESDVWADLLIICRWANPTTNITYCSGCGNVIFKTCATGSISATVRCETPGCGKTINISITLEIINITKRVSEADGPADGSSLFAKRKYIENSTPINITFCPGCGNEILKICGIGSSSGTIICDTPSCGCTVKSSTCITVEDTTSTKRAREAADAVDEEPPSAKRRCSRRAAKAVAGAPVKSVAPFQPKDLAQLIESLIAVCPRWERFGLQLGLTSSELEAIRKNTQDSEDCLRKVLDKRLKVKPLPRHEVVQALNAKSVGLGHLAINL